MSGDVPISTFEALALDYLGTVPTPSYSEVEKEEVRGGRLDPLEVITLGRDRQLGRIYISISIACV